MLDTNNPTVFIGALILIASAGLFGVRFLKPAIAREYDVVISIVGLIYGLILLWEGWRLIPLLFFGQILLISTCGFFAFETLRMRSQLVDRARQSGGPVGRTGTRRSSGSGSVRGGISEREPEGRTLGGSRRQLRSAEPRQLASSNPGRRRPNLDDPEPPPPRRRRRDEGTDPRPNDNTDTPRTQDSATPPSERRRRPRNANDPRKTRPSSPDSRPRPSDQDAYDESPPTRSEAPEAYEERRRPPRLPDDDITPIVDIDQLDDLDDDLT